jgi:hypothetical protein
MPDFTWTVPSGMQAVTPTGLEIVRNADLTAVQQVAAGAAGTKTATSSLTAAPRGFLALTLGLSLAGSGGVNPDPNPDPDPDPVDDYRSIRFINGSTASAWFKVDAVNPDASGNPAGADYPGYRGPNQLVVYTNPPTSTTVTNQYGVEVQVGSDDVVDAVNDRLANADTNGTSVPSGGYVVSGHDAAAQFLRGAAGAGYTVELNYELPPGVDPTPVPDPDPVGNYPSAVVSVYKMMWSTNGPNISSIASGCNEIRLSFLQGDPPTQVGWGAQGESSTLADIAAKVAAGVRIIWSIGGQGGAINTGSRTNFLNGIASARSALGGNLHGIDWDVEASSLNQSDVVFISTQLKSLYGSEFAITMAPNGGNVGQYLPTAVALHRAGALDNYGQQFYDAPVSLAAAKGRISEAIGAGLPESKISVGMMIASDSNHWTNAQCRSYYTDIRNTWPGIRKAYLWEAQRAGTAEWIGDMARING